MVPVKRGMPATSPFMGKSGVAGHRPRPRLLYAVIGRATPAHWSPRRRCQRRHPQSVQADWTLNLFLATAALDARAASGLCSKWAGVCCPNNVQRAVARAPQVRSHRFLCCLHRTSPDNLSGRLSLKHSWLFRERIDASALFRGRLFNDDKFCKTRQQEGAILP